MIRKLMRYLLLSIGVIGSVFMYFNTTQVNSRKHSFIVDAIMEIKHNDTDLKRNIMQSRIGLLQTYDPLVSLSRKNKILLDQLEADFEGIVDPDLPRALQKYRELLNVRAELLEHFKSENAVLRNSMHYFPVVAQKLEGRFAEFSRLSSMRSKVNQLSQGILYYNASPNEEMRSLILERIDYLRSVEPRAPADIRRELGVFLRHSDNIIGGMNEVRRLTDDIFDLPLEKTLNQLIEIYLFCHGKGLYEERVYRLFLYVFIVLMVLYIIRVILELRFTAGELLVARDQLQEMNHSLELKVEKRTEQLKKSFDQLHALKEQQDGDYFLTSLLMKPLGGNHTAGGRVNIEFLERQKKRFKFRKWNAEIGGDLCVAHDLTLRGRRCTVFVNGDAMGKSIQGAGGAIILGTAYKAIISKTEDIAEQVYPELWIEFAFQAIQDIFVTFDGSMLASAVLGLVDEASGLLYYVNAEHPDVVLYRNGQAVFLRNETYIPKFGIAELDRYLEVKVFALQDNDVLLVGSDGRDDILLACQGKQRVINEDESLILQHVERGGGELLEIESSILNSGSMTDDFTLIRLGFCEDLAFQETPEVPVDFSVSLLQGAGALRAGRLEEAVLCFERAVGYRADDATALRSLARVYMLQRRFERAAMVWERCCEAFPQVLRFLYLASWSYKLAGNFEAARVFAERYRLRRRKSIRNLRHLMGVYMVLELFGDVQRISGEIEELLSVEMSFS